MQVLSAGVDGLLFPEFVESPITLVSAKGAVGPHLADHAMALLLALMRGLHTSIRARTWKVQGGVRRAPGRRRGRHRCRQREEERERCEECDREFMDPRRAQRPAPHRLESGPLRAVNGKDQERIGRHADGRPR